MSVETTAMDATLCVRPAEAIYRKPCAEDVRKFAAVMRREDARELKRWTGNTAEYELARAVELSDICLLAELPGGAMLSMFGAMRSNLLEREGVIGELSTQEVEKHRFLFAKSSRKMFHEMARRMPDVAEFHNYVDTEYTRAVAWIEWLGGTLTIGGAFRGVCGGVFRKFIIGNPYCKP